jgi:hypothetical protein
MVAGVAVVAVSTWVGVAVLAAPSPARTATATSSGGTFQAPGGGGDGFFRRGTTGTIQSVHGPTLTLIDRQQQPVLVTTTAQTVYTKAVVGSARDVKRGDFIMVSGVLSEADSTLTAGRVTILGAASPSLGARLLPPGGRTPATTSIGVATGTVTDTNGDSWTLNQFGGGLVTVLVGPATIVSRMGSGSLSDLKPGQTVVVRGSVSDDSSIVAADVQEGGDLGGFGGGALGRAPQDGATTGFGPDGSTQS